ncbi:hypothetical protein H4R34_000430 [Dimargaris verticillata]|uniref:Uncharacterized protein n=1 Tax=Dimargaris verticillata TaxID=2761393 RepID=A0A9W8BBU0_9FUNG|nr:hypothetical protein H4R34_000430 [Dimargaris verticillata]
MKVACLVVALLLALAVAQPSVNQEQGVSDAAADAVNGANTDTNQAVTKGDGNTDAGTGKGVDENTAPAGPRRLSDPFFDDLVYRRHVQPADMSNSHPYYGYTKRGSWAIERRSFGGVGAPGFGTGKRGGLFGIPTFFVNQDKFNLKKAKLQKFNFKNIKKNRKMAAKKTKFIS